MRNLQLINGEEFVGELANGTLVDIESPFWLEKIDRILYNNKMKYEQRWIFFGGGNMDIRRAAKAVEILNAWPSVLQALVGDTNASLASGIIGYEFACAAEMIRNYSGWATADQTVFKNMMLNKSYPKLAFERQHS